MDISIAITHWTCLAQCEKELAVMLAGQWNGFAAAMPKALMLLLASSYAPGWGELRLDAFVANWDCSYESIPIEGLDIEFVVTVNPWAQQVDEAHTAGDLPMGAPTCRQAVGFP